MSAPQPPQPPSQQPPSEPAKPLPRSLMRLRLASGFFLVLLFTGLYPWLRPLSLAGQWALVLHSVAGLVAIPLLARLFWRHARHGQKYQPSRWYQPPILAGVGIAALAATGVALIGVGLFGSDTPYRLHEVHLWLGFGAGALIVYHIVAGLLRAHFPQKRGVGLLVPVGAGLVAVLVGGLVLAKVRSQPRIHGDFSPSNARTAGNLMVAPALLNNSQSCQRCHAQIYREWLPGAHHYSATDIFYQAVRTNYIHARGPEAVHYCEGCHEPLTLVGGFTPHVGVQPEARQGSSCAFCHSLRHLATRGNANYVVDPPTPYLFEESSNPVLLRVSSALIRLDPALHNHDYNVKPSQTAVFCGSCHKQYIDAHENGWGFVQLQDQYDDWKNGPWHTNKKANLQCQDCHMRLRPSDDPARNAQGMIHDHRILASNSFMPSLLHLPGAQRQQQLVLRWMQGKTVIPEIADRWPRGSVVSLEMSPEGTIEPGGTAHVRAVVINSKVGHAFPTGPLDVTQAWLELQVTDVSTGKVVYQTGYLNKDNAVTGDTIQFRSYLLDRNGQPIYTHSLWNAVGGRDKRAILPGMSDTKLFQFPIPRNSQGPFKCELNLLYRRFNDQSQRLLLPPQVRAKVPIITVASSTLFLPVGHPGAAAIAQGR